MDLVPLKKHSLTRAQFEQLTDVPPEEEWLANITNLKTRRAYKEDVREFISFTALQDYMGLRSVGRAGPQTLGSPPADTLKGVRDRAILATLLYHGIRREELCGLRVKDLHSRQGVMHFRVKGKRSKAAKATVHSKALFRDRNQTIKRTLFTLEGRSDQSARIHAQRLKLFKFGSLEPNNSDSFVSLPLEQRTRGVFRRCYPSFVLKLRDPRLPDALVIECDPAICHLADACAFIQERYIRFF